jgi:hypothetical protein
MSFSVKEAVCVAAGCRGSGGASWCRVDEFAQSVGSVGQFGAPAGSVGQSAGLYGQSPGSWRSLRAGWGQVSPTVFMGQEEGVIR